MNDILKAAKLDFSLIRPYMKTICFTLLIPVFFIALNRSLLTGVSFAMCLISVTEVYTFSISEKNGMDRLYGILPIPKKHLVLGRYLYNCLMGFLALLFSLIVHPIVLRLLGETVEIFEFSLAAILGVLMFTFYTVFQLPGFYKYGPIKGKVFMYIPIVSYLAIILLFSRFNTAGEKLFSFIINNPIVAAAVLLLIVICAFLISIVISIRALKSKEV